MLSYLLNGRALWLTEDTSVRITYKNPCCYFDGIPGDVGLGIEIPVNDFNRALFGNPQRFSKLATGANRKFPGFEVRFSGVLFLSGTLVIQDASETNYQGWLQSNLGVLGEAQREKKMTEMSWPVAQNFSEKESYSDDVDHYNIVAIQNPGFWDGKGKEVPNDTVYADEDGIDETRPEKISSMAKSHFENYAWYINNHALPTINPGLVISPYLYLRYVIKESLRLNRWFIGRNEMTSGIYGLNLWANLSIYNNFNIVDIAPETELVEDWTWDDYLKRMVQVGFHQITEFNWAVTQFSYRNLLPKIKYRDFLLGIQNYLNFVFRFRHDMRVDIIDRNAVLSHPAIDIDKYLVGTWRIGQQKDVTLKFISEYDKNDTNFDSGFEDLSDRRSMFRDSVATYNDLLALPNLSIGEIRLVRAENKYYEYKWKPQVLEDISFQEIQYDALDWEFISSGPQPYFYGTAAEVEEIKTAISTVQMTGLDGFVRFPMVNQKGNLASTPNAYNDFSMRLITGNTVLWPEGLYWEGDYGLFKTRWETWARFWKSRLDIEATFDLPVNVLISLVENITEPHRTREGEFIVEEIEVTLGMYSIGKAQLKGYKK